MWPVERTNINVSGDLVIIEVGANTGSHTEGYAQLGRVFAFEPNPILFNDLFVKFRDNPNVVVVPLAVDLRNDVCEFNVSDEGDRGVGSLYDFDAEFLKGGIGQHAMFQAGFVYKHRTLSIRLDTFMSLWRIEHVDWLHIDAQGADFRVIQSLGSKLDRIKAGCCECTYKVPLYRGSDQFNNYDDCLKYLDLHGFDATIGYVHEGETECDINFTRR